MARTTEEIYRDLIAQAQGQGSQTQKTNDNILQYAEGILDENEQYRFLCDMLDGTGLSDSEIKQICLCCSH